MTTIFFEILIVLFFPPLKLIARIFGTRARDLVGRVEERVIRYVHAMGMEERTRYELEMQVGARAELAAGMIDQSDAMPRGDGDSTQQAMRIAGANQSLPPADDPHAAELQRGPTRVEASDPDQSRSEQMQEALLQAQRDRRAAEERRERRRRR